MIRRIIKHRFFTASFWVFIGIGATNVFNYLFHVSMGRLLSPQEYGVLESSVALLYLVSIPLATLGLVIVKFVSEYRGRENHGAIAELHRYFRSLIVKYGIVIVLLLLIFSPTITKFLHLPSVAIVILVIVSLVVGMYMTLVKSIIQGMSHFFAFTLISVGESAGKLIFGILFVLLGLKSFGSLLGAILGAVLAGLIGIRFLSIGSGEKKAVLEKKRLIIYSIPVFLTMLGMVSIYTTDIILVRHFFSSEASGHYSAVSVLGKVVVFALSPINIVMFPLISEYHAKGERYTTILFISIFLTLMGTSFIATLYYMFPNFIIGFFGPQYEPAVPLLGRFGLFMVFYSLSTLLANFYLSIHEVMPSLFVLMAAILQVLLIVLFHSSLFQVIDMSILTSFVLLTILLLYQFFNKKNQVASHVLI